MHVDNVPAPPDSDVAKIVQATQDGFVTIDADSRIVAFNDAAERMFGYKADEVAGQDVKLLMPEPYAREHAGYIKRYEETGEPHAIGRIRTVMGKRKDGEEFPIELSVTQIGEGNAAQYGAFIRDISEKVRLQRELLDRERLATIGTTAAKFAHEVSNPLNGMFTQVQLMQRRLARAENPDERLQRGVEMLLRDIDRLNGLLDEFRSLSRRPHMDARPTDLVALCRELVMVEGPRMAEVNVKIEQKLEDGVPAVRADADKIKQVLLNLCKNAAEAMPDGGTVTVTAHVHDDRVALKIADTGQGIPDGLDIFAPFATSKPEGTGLGLPIVRQIITAHGGALHCDSDESGTTFTVELPRVT